MKRPAIIFDRDNTIIVTHEYLGDPEKVVLMEGAADAVARARSLGFATVICSNQSGVARGMFDEDAVFAVNKKIDQMLLAANRAAVIDRHEFCPFHPEAKIERYKQDSDKRKPKPGMILAAAEKLALDLSRSWVIGDAPRDIIAGKAAGCRTILFQPQGVAVSPASEERLTLPPDSIVNSLKEAMNFVEANLSPADPGEPAPSMKLTLPAPEPSAARTTNADMAKLEQLAEQILQELRRRNDRAHYSDFSVSKLMAGIVQVLAVAVMLLSYLNRNNPEFFQQYIFFAILFQCLTIALLIMGKDRT